MSTTAIPTITPTSAELPALRLHLLRAGYLLVGLGLVAVKWPLLPSAASLPVFEGVVACMLVALSLLALLGVRHPVRMLPVLVFETGWKLLWLGVVALPKAAAGELDAATADILVSCSVVVVVIAVTPWRYVWRTYVSAEGERWR